MALEAVFLHLYFNSFSFWGRLYTRDCGGTHTKRVCYNACALYIIRFLAYAINTHFRNQPSELGLEVN